MLQRLLTSLLFPVPLFALVFGVLTAAPSAGQDKKPVLQYKEVDVGGGVKMKLVLIPAGKFMMGSDDEKAHKYEKPQHEVEITRPFFMGVYLVTQVEYEKVMGKNPSAYSPAGGYKDKVASLKTARFPVDSVSWNDANVFCDKLKKKVGKTFDLPTEAEWEYACRAGSTGTTHYGTGFGQNQANIADSFLDPKTHMPTGLGRPSEVGLYQPNAFGLYDMHGNLMEWCKDWFQGTYYQDSPTEDPTGPVTAWNVPQERYSAGHVLRGGSFGVLGVKCRSAAREAGGVDDNRGTGPNIGFRVIMRP